MSEFYPGQTVVCVDSQGQTVEGSPLVVGRKYTVKALLPRGHDLGLTVIEADPPAAYAAFWSELFSPLESKAMQIFRAIAANPTIKIKENA